MAKRLPPPIRENIEIRGFQVTGYIVGSWVPEEGKPAEAVGISFWVRGKLPALTMRLKTPQAVDTMIQALLRHKRDVWPEAP